MHIFYLLFRGLRPKLAAHLPYIISPLFITLCFITYTARSIHLLCLYVKNSDILYVMQRLQQLIQRHKLFFIIPICALIVYSCIAVFLYTSDSKTFKGNTTYSDVSVENLSIDETYAALSQHLGSTPVAIQVGDTTLQTTAENLGVAIDLSALEAQINEQRLRYSLFPFVYKKEFMLPLETNQDRLVTTARSVELPADKKAPVDASVDYVNKSVTILPETAGSGLDTSILSAELQKQLREGKKEITLIMALTTVQPRVTKQALSQRMNDITTILSKTYTITDGANSYAFPTTAIAKSLYIDENNQLKPNYSATADMVSTAIQKFTVQPVKELSYSYSSGKQPTIFQKGVIGKSVTNEAELITQLQNNVQSANDMSMTVIMADVPYASRSFSIDDTKNKVYSYSIENWGTTSSLAYFREKAAETLLSEKGWSRAGISFVEVTDQSDFTLVLSEGAEMSRRYSPACDDYYSCRVGSYVIINDSRWQNATPVWPKDIAAYQNLVINHETGHWLGLGHYYCTEPGAPAPVMQQQSIDIRNCTYNEWPLEYEIQKL